jgi:hypothetical protein
VAALAALPRTEAIAPLAKILGMLGSDAEGEVLAAAARAEEMRRALSTTWHALLSGAAQTMPFAPFTHQALMQTEVASTALLEALRAGRVTKKDGEAVIRACHAVQRAVASGLRDAIEAALATLRATMSMAGLG